MDSYLDLVVGLRDSRITSVISRIMLGCLVEELQGNPGEVRPSLGTKTVCSTAE